MSCNIFSATGNILKCSCQCDVWIAPTVRQNLPDCEVVWSKRTFDFDKKKYILIGEPASCLTMCSVIPGLSIGSGSVRAFLGLVHAVVHLIAALWNRGDISTQDAHLKQAKFGVIQIGQGILEIIPFAGGVIHMIYLNALYADCKEKIKNQHVVINDNEVARFYSDEDLPRKTFDKSKYFKPLYLSDEI